MTVRGFWVRVSVLVGLAVVGLVWPAMGSMLPDLDGALAPGGATLAGLFAAAAAVVGRVLYVVLAPGIAAVLATDLVMWTPRPGTRVSVPPCGSLSSQR